MLGVKLLGGQAARVRWVLQAAKGDAVPVLKALVIFRKLELVGVERATERGSVARVQRVVQASDEGSLAAQPLVLRRDGMRMRVRVLGESNAAGFVRRRRARHRQQRCGLGRRLRGRWQNRSAWRGQRRRRAK